MGSTSSLEERIITVIDEKIRPFIERDGGRIQFHSLSGDTVLVELSGACSSCSAASITLKSGVERILRKEFREIKTVKSLANA
ncbi:MAG: NifU family protein [Candidatus Kapaibacterium sp.]|nr:MAG: NifU family protein [Candidatus Kapabacteria bacterium]